MSQTMKPKRMRKLGSVVGIVCVAVLICVGIAGMLVLNSTLVISDSTRGKPVAVFIGDSYSVGEGITNGSARWTSIVASDFGWIESNYAFGGTGYSRNGLLAGCGRIYCPNYDQVIDRLFGEPPSFVVISGGRNDEDASSFETSVLQTLSKAQSKWPETTVIVTSPIWGSETPPAWFSGVASTAREVATSNGVAYLDLGEPFRNRPDLLGPDGIHPNEAGQRVLAMAFERAMQGASVLP